MSGLYDIDRGGREHTLKDASESDILNIGISRINPVSFKKMVDTVDNALKNLKPSDRSNLTWTMCGSLLGYNSSEPTKSTNHLWNKAYEAFKGHSKSSNIFVGCLVRWRIVNRAKENNEVWLTTRQETGGVDFNSGDPIMRSCYWINNSWKNK
jgi:hypothetical protein